MGLLSALRAFRQGLRANDAFKAVPPLFGIVPSRAQVLRLHQSVAQLADVLGGADLALYIATRCMEDLSLTPESSAIALRARVACDIGKAQHVYTNEELLARFYSATARLLPEDDHESATPLPEQGWSTEGRGFIAMSDPPDAFEDLPDWLQITPGMTRLIEDHAEEKKRAALARERCIEKPDAGEAERKNR